MHYALHIRVMICVYVNGKCLRLLVLVLVLAETECSVKVWFGEQFAVRCYSMSNRMLFDGIHKLLNSFLVCVFYIVIIQPPGLVPQ